MNNLVNILNLKINGIVMIITIMIFLGRLPDAMASQQSAGTSRK